MIYFDTEKYTEYQVLKTFDVHEWSSMGYWQIAYAYDDEIIQILDVHAFLEDCESEGLCKFKGTQFDVFCNRMLAFMELHGLESESDLEDFHGQLWDDISPCDVKQVFSDIINYDLFEYLDGLCHTPHYYFGPNPNGGCLGYWLDEEDPDLVM